MPSAEHIEFIYSRLHRRLEHKHQPTAIYIRIHQQARRWQCRHSPTLSNWNVRLLFATSKLRTYNTIRVVWSACVCMCLCARKCAFAWRVVYRLNDDVCMWYWVRIFEHGGIRWQKNDVRTIAMVCLSHPQTILSERASRVTKRLCRALRKRHIFWLAPWTL